MAFLFCVARIGNDEASGFTEVIPLKWLTDQNYGRIPVYSARQASKFRSAAKKIEDPQPLWTEVKVKVLRNFGKFYLVSAFA